MDEPPDDTDVEILRLLMNDSRRPWSDIAEAVGLSPPAVSDRVGRLREMGINRRSRSTSIGPGSGAASPP